MRNRKSSAEAYAELRAAIEELKLELVRILRLDKLLDWISARIRK